MSSNTKTEGEIDFEVRDQLSARGWKDQLRYQHQIAPGRIYKVGDSYINADPVKPDFILDYKPDIEGAEARPIAVVEDKNVPDVEVAAGIQQAKNYAEIMNLKFAYTTNGNRIVEYDFTTGEQKEIPQFPTPEELWERSQGSKPFKAEDLPVIFQPYNREVRNSDLSIRKPRYYQIAAIEAVTDVIAKGQKRILVTMATGTGKTFVAMQIAWKLWKPKKVKPRILYLVDRIFLQEQAEELFQKPFKTAMSRILEKGSNTVVKSKDIYFSLYQGISDRKKAEGVYKKFNPDFFDYVIIDECHRGSARDDGNWRAILDYFKSATHIGMTATPKTKDNANTYKYFKRPVYTYTLKQGINDGYLSPYSVIRVTTDVDVKGWRPKPNQKDKYGNLIPDKQYELPQFDKKITLEPRIMFVAAHLVKHLQDTNPYDKTLVFCQDQQHALDLTTAINNISPVKHPRYCVRIVAEERENLRRQLKEQFSDPESKYPVIVTTSKLLSTGIDIPTLKNIVIDKSIRDMVEFKQTVGRGTRVNLSDKPFQLKYWFTIIDHRGVSKHFEDPKFDGKPDEIDVEKWEKGKPPKIKKEIMVKPPGTDLTRPRKKQVRPVATGFEVSQEGKSYWKLDAEGNKLSLYKYEDYTRENVRTLYPDKMELYRILKEPEKRKHFIEELSKIGIDLKELQEITNNKDKDEFEVLIQVVTGDPIMTRKDKITKIRGQKQLFSKYKEKARRALDVILDLYADKGYGELDKPKEILELPQIKKIGSTREILTEFGNYDEYVKAIETLTKAIYER